MLFTNSRFSKISVSVLMVSFSLLSWKVSSAEDGYWAFNKLPVTPNYLTASSDASKIIMTGVNGYLYASTDSGATWVQKTFDSSRNWSSIASDASGSKIFATVNGGYIYASTDSGNTWMQKTTDTTRAWRSITASADGTKVAAIVSAGYIYTSMDGGSTWTQKTSDARRSWSSIASDASGSKIFATVNGGYIYASTDSGNTWMQKTTDTTRAWRSITASADGTKVAAIVDGGYIYTSTDGGSTWMSETSAGSRAWNSIKYSPDGRSIVVTSISNSIYASTNSGLTWTDLNSVGTKYIWSHVLLSYDGSRIFASTKDGNLGEYKKASNDKYYLKVLTPNGGEAFKDGDNINIKWNTNLPKRQKLELVVSMDNHDVGKVIGSIYAGLPSFNWKAKYIDSIVSTESNPPTTFNSNGKFKISLSCPMADKVCVKSDGNNYFDFSDSAFTIQPPFIPVINSVSPESSAVSRKVMISSNNLPEKNVNVKFVGTKVYSGTSTMQYVSPVEFEHVVKNVKVLDGSKIEFTIPSSVIKRSNSIRAVNSIVKVVPGYYQIIIETPTGSSKPFYFKVENPRIVEASPVVVKAVGSKIEKSYGNTNNATSVNSTSFEVDVYANRGDVYLGKSDSLWPAFSADNQSVELYKDGVLVNPKEYGLSVSYAQPVGTNYSSSDNSFVLLSGKSTRMTVYYKFYTMNPSASLYQLKMKNIMWSQDVSGRMAGTKINKTTPVSASSLVSN